MRPAVLLAELNEIDLLVDGIHARLAQIAEALREPAAVRAARATLAAADADLAHWQEAQTAAEAEQQQAAAKLARAEQRLYSGAVRNPKELEDGQRDQQQLRRQQAQAEDVLLEALVRVESATEKRATSQTELDRLVADWEASRVKLRAEQARLAAQLPNAQARQAAARRAVPPQLLPLYDSLRSRRGGRAVAEVDGEVCTACKVAVSPSKLEAARYGDELVYCDNCGRLLWGE
jgi:uncharacterized protein